MADGLPSNADRFGHASMTVNGRTANGRRPLLVILADSQRDRASVQQTLVSEGLGSSRRIIVGRHGGEISIDLPRGETVSRMWLPRHITEAQRV